MVHLISFKKDFGGPVFSNQLSQIVTNEIIFPYLVGEDFFAEQSRFSQGSIEKS
jgi:hypothetical protein